MTPIQAIRANCLECAGGQAKEVRLCPIPHCPCYPFRFGKNPNIVRTMTDSQKTAASERLKEARGKRVQCTLQEQLELPGEISDDKVEDGEVAA